MPDKEGQYLMIQESILQEKLWTHMHLSWAPKYMTWKLTKTRNGKNSSTIIVRDFPSRLSVTVKKKKQLHRISDKKTKDLTTL